MSDKVKDGITL